MSGLLNGAVKLVELQFAFSNILAVPSGLFEKEREALGELTARKSEIKGTQFLFPTPDVSILQFPGDLADAGFAMVDAFYKMRANPRGQEYPVVKFIFVSEDNLKSEGEFAKHKKNAEKAIAQMCEQAMWRVRGFLNPFFQDREVIEGAHAVSVNLEARSPLVDGEGNPILRWRKDEKGERIGDRPVPIQPKLFLRIVNDDICVVSAS